MAEKPVSILLLAENEKAAALERRALRDIGAQHVRLCSSGIEAVLALAGRAPFGDGFKPDLVICQSQLEDMDGEQFCAIARQHPLLKHFPIILVLANDQEAKLLFALGCEASAIIGRPYSLDALKREISSLMADSGRDSVVAAPADNAQLKAFDEAVATYGVLLKAGREPEDFFRAGMRCLSDQRWNGAVAAFERAMRDERFKADAELGLAAAWRGLGDMGKFRHWLGVAGESFLASKKWARARKTHARLLQQDPGARNPFLAEAHRLARQGEYAQAAEVMAEGLPIIARRKIGERYARVCLAAEEPDRMFVALQSALATYAGPQHEALGQEIRSSLDVMEEQKEDRQRAQAAERKWELSRAMKSAAARQAAQSRLEAPPLAVDPASPKERIPGSRPPEVRIEKAVAEFVEDDSDTEEAVPTLAPLAPQPAKSGFHELWSVIKLTWKLSRKADKHS